MSVPDPLPPRSAAYKRELMDRYWQASASTLTAAFVVWLVASLTGYTHSTHAQIARILGFAILLGSFIVFTTRLDIAHRRGVPLVGVRKFIHRATPILSALMGSLLVQFAGTWFGK